MINNEYNEVKRMRMWAYSKNISNVSTYWKHLDKGF